jgi:hypothetical protein
VKLIFIHGAPAVGKLTIARELASLTGFRLFHNHLTVDLVSSVFDFGSESFIALRERIWLSVFREAAERKVSLIFTFNPERTVRNQFVQDAVDAVETAGGRIIFVELTCDSEEIKRRIESPSRSEFGKLRSVRQYQELLDEGAFEFQSLPDSGISLDTTNITPERAAELIKERLSVI